MLEVFTRDAKRCVEDVVFEIVCTCNLKTLIYAEGGVIKLPPAHGGCRIEDVVERYCGGLCLSVRDSHRVYVLVFYTLKLGLENLAKLIKDRCASLT
ncbi:hypothetical protein P186_1790 [Pyrobaculum ferrireducens]|uniref:Uncharacterized protein n=2 Tax=Pyrobaculum ferrireducens TaxID=1104324 RepID=G7VH27_9CREN|nr:hypothetical protein P186_1790 [Pyrobaculum ferrireducens]